MKSIELEDKEWTLIKEINNDESLLNSALKYIRNLKMKAAHGTLCQFTADEKEAILLKGEADADLDLGVSQADFEKEFAGW